MVLPQPNSTSSFSKRTFYCSQKQLRLTNKYRIQRALLNYKQSEKYFTSYSYLHDLRQIPDKIRGEAIKFY